MKFVRISGGSYRRGDFTSQNWVPDLQDNPCQLHDVEISGFYIQETEVTNEQIAEFALEIGDGSLKSWKDGRDALIDVFKKPREEVPRYPAICVNRTTAQKLAERIGGRLPTEAEWEYAARSGGQECRWAGRNRVAKKDVPKARLYSLDNADDPTPVAVKSFANEDETDQKVFDLTGNVREWCIDVYKPYPAIISEHKKSDPAGVSRPLSDPREGDEPDKNNPKQKYVVRGGAFNMQPDEAKTFQRNAMAADSELNDLGFRVVIQCPPDIVVVE